MKGIRVSRLVVFLSLLNALGCQKGEDEDFLEGAPEMSALQLEITGDTASEGTDTGSAEESLDSVGSVVGGLEAVVAPSLAGAREAIKNLNAALRAHLQPIAALIRDSAPSTQPGAVRTWGPVTRGTTDYRFQMRKGVLARRFGWVLEARVTGTGDDAWKVVAAGAITLSTVARRGTGVVGFDLDALGALDPTVVARGKLLARFAHGPLGTALAYALKNFTPDPAKRDAIDALFHGIHTKAGKNLLRLAYHGNLPGSPSETTVEMALARVRHMRGVGGRADVLASKGDVPEGHVYAASECWTAGAEQVFYVLRDCVAGNTEGPKCEILKTEGSPTACDKGLAMPEFTPASPTEPMSEPESPEPSLAPPTDMPDGSGP
jgi:hypothetical protein